MRIPYLAFTIDEFVMRVLPSETPSPSIYGAPGASPT
jgi:hypothetical protein